MMFIHVRLELTHVMVVYPCLVGADTFDGGLPMSSGKWELTCEGGFFLVIGADTCDCGLSMSS